MGNHKDPNKAPEVPYSGALKKLFEHIQDANFPYNDADVNIGRKYKIQQRIAIPRQWYLELYKLPKESGFGFRVAVNGAILLGTDPAFVTLTNVSVTDVKLNGHNIFVWVENSSGSVANLIFNSEEDKFQARLFTNSVADHDEALKEVHEELFLQPQDIRDLNGDSQTLTRVLKAVLSLLHKINKKWLIKVSKVEGPKGRKKSVTIAPVLVAPSRDILKNKGKAAVGTQGRNDNEVQGTIQDLVIEKGTSSGQLPTGLDSKETRSASVETPIATKKRRLKVSPKNKKRVPSDNPKPQSPETRRTLEVEFQAACLVEVEAPSTMMNTKKRRDRIHQHPRKTAPGKEIDFEDRRDELKQFKERVKPIFIFGQEKVKMVSVEKMKYAPKDMKYRPVHDSLVNCLLDIFLTAIHPQKQTLTLMPDCKVKPKSYEDVKDGEFYIINGQHSYAAAKLLLANPYVSEEQKKVYGTWSCDFVWTQNLLLLSELSRRINNTNQHRWNSPEYLLHIQYARDIWAKYKSPQPRGHESKKYKEFQLKAVETLNSMSEKNASKNSTEYQGELKVICADDDLYTLITNAFKLYEAGELVNPDTGKKWREDSEVEWIRKLTVAYTFKCVRSLGRESLLELVQKITAGLDEDGNLITSAFQYPKVYLAANKPKNKHTSSLKEWTDRKKAKNVVVRWFNHRYQKELWSGEDVNAKEWKDFKEEVGFTSAHMDELIWRGTKKFLSKSLKVSDKPRRKQVPPPEAFLAEIERVLNKKGWNDTSLAPFLSLIQEDGSVSEFLRERTEEDDEDLIVLEKATEGMDTFVVEDIADMAFVGGIMDLRLVDTLLEKQNLANPSMSYVSILSHFATMLAVPSHWMVIAHSNKTENVIQALQHYFLDWNHSESRYVPTANEKYFFSTAILKKGNGVVIFLLRKEDKPPLFMEKQVISKERHKKIGEVRESILEVHSHELRMEVYLHFITQAKSQESRAGVHNFFFITAGMKSMIAAVMLGLRPVAAVLADPNFTSSYWEPHKVGCRLQGFNHLFDTTIQTNDIVARGVWPCVHYESNTNTHEVRKKMKQDPRSFNDESADELEESTENSSNEFGPDEDSQQDIQTPNSFKTLEMEGTYFTPPTTSSPPTPLPLVATQCVSTELQCGMQVKQSQKSSLPISFKGKFVADQILKKSPAEQIFKKSSFFQHTVGPEQMLEGTAGASKRTTFSNPLDTLIPLQYSPTLVVNCQSVPDDEVLDQMVRVQKLLEQPNIFLKELPSPEQPNIDMQEVQPLQELPIINIHEVFTLPAPPIVSPEVAIISMQEVLSLEVPNIGLELNHPTTAVKTLQVVPKDESQDVTIQNSCLKSNEANPIVIDSDEDDHLVLEVRSRLPSDTESELSEGLQEDPIDPSTEVKVSAQKALRIQLKGISKNKISLNRANLLKNRELEIQNMKLLRELVAERKLREEANEKLRSCGIGIISLEISDSLSPSTSPSYQATTSIASAPQMSVSEADLEGNPIRHGREDFVAGTQESAVAKPPQADEAATIEKGLEASKNKYKQQKPKSHNIQINYLRKKRYSCNILDVESSSPNQSNFAASQPKPRICISNPVMEDIDEVTSSLCEP